MRSPVLFGLNASWPETRWGVNEKTNKHSSDLLEFKLGLYLGHPKIIFFKNGV